MRIRGEAGYASLTDSTAGILMRRARQPGGLEFVYEHEGLWSRLWKLRPHALQERLNFGGEHTSGG